MKDNSFINSSALTRVFEKKMLNTPKIKRLLEADTIEDAVGLLEEYSYIKQNFSDDNINRYETLLQEELKKSFDYFYEISPNKDLVEIATYKYVFHNVKVFCKEILTKSDLSELYIDIGQINIKNLENNSTKKVLSSDEKYILNTIHESIENYLYDQDSQKMDINIDKKYCEFLSQNALELKNDFIINYFKNLIDFSNFKMFLRQKKQNKDNKFFENSYFPGGNIKSNIFIDSFNSDILVVIERIKKYPIGKYVQNAYIKFLKNNDFFEFDKEMNIMKIDTLSKNKFISYGEEVIFSTLVARELEIENLRIILVSKKIGLNKEDIRRKICDSYV